MKTPPRARSPFSARALLAAGLLVLAAAGAAGQVKYDAGAEQLFASALVSYRAASYRNSEQLLDSLTRRYPNSHRITAALIMRGKALFALEENYEASKTAKTLVSGYPSSRYVPDAELLLGRIYARNDGFDDARDAALRAWETLGPDAPPRLTREVVSLMDSLLYRHTTLPVLYALLRRSGEPPLRGHLWTVAARRELARGNTLAATAAVDSIALRYGNVVPRETVGHLRAELSNATTLKLGILLPLMRESPPSALKEVGNEVCEGILAAFDRSSTSMTVPLRLSLDVRDTRRDPGTAASEAKALAADGTVVAILGPVFSATTTAAARVASSGGVPLVTPTANQNGIAGLGAMIFQANPDYELRGRAMARYAVERLGFHVLAVLSPSDTYAKFLADGFVSEARALGADVAATEWYQKGTADLRSQLLDIRRRGFRQGAEAMISFAGKMARLEVMKLVGLGVRPSLVDSLLSASSVVPVRLLLGPRGKELVDSAGVKVVYEEGRTDSLRFPAGGIEALYCPVSSPEEIGIVSSQIAYFNIKTQLLGSGEWNSLSQLETNRRYTLGVRFESDSYIDTSASAYREFLGVFTARFRKQPGKNTLFGYDAASLVLSVLGRGAATRAALAQALALVREYRGVRGRIGFTSGRVNSWMHVLEYTEDGIIHVGEISGEP